MSLTDGLWAWWRLNEKDGQRLDASGNGRHLVDNGNVGSVPASLGVGAVFSGTPGQYLSLPEALPPGSFSVALWAQLLGLTGGPAMWAQGDGASLQKLFVLVASWRFQTQDNFGTYIPHGPLPVPWRHVAGVFDEELQRITIYLDGARPAVSNGEPLAAGAVSMALGARPDGTAENFKGSIALCGLWTRALAGGEVAELFADGAGLDYPFNA